MGKVKQIRTIGGDRMTVQPTSMVLASLLASYDDVGGGSVYLDEVADYARNALRQPQPSVEAIDSATAAATEQEAAQLAVRVERLLNTIPPGAWLPMEWRLRHALRELEGTAGQW